MTRRDLDKLNTITARVEAFQNRPGCDKDAQSVKDALRTAKDALIDAWNNAEHPRY